ncbi:MAG: DUF1800 family protein [Candidatus Latescibacteria bacterium]|nr:DUF1800 family protein [Candidatus Latescibacterota bacterium]
MQALIPQSGPLTSVQARHLLRRSGFGASVEAVAQLVGGEPAQVVRLLVQQAIGQADPPAPEWAEALPPAGADRTDIRDFLAASQPWLRQFQDSWSEYIPQGGLRERMVLFWHDHFATRAQAYGRSGSVAYRHVALLRHHALGDFRALVRAVGLDPAMLLFLDGARSTGRQPNENYGRELLELFTMGIGHYSEGDIAEGARALTGYVVNYHTLEAEFVPTRFDAGEKIFLGQSGAWGYDDIVDIIFARRGLETARFIVAKLYRHFVYEEPDEEVVEELAQLFVQRNFALAPVVEALLASAHFYQPHFIGARIKSPVEFLCQLYLGADRTPSAEEGLVRRLGQLGQELLNPPDVAGWPGHHQWLTTTTLPLRWGAAETLIYNRRLARPDLVALARRLPQPYDAEELTRDLVAHWLAVQPAQAEIETLTEALLGGIPAYEWDLDDEGAGTRLLGLFNVIARLPEYQLT